jgi:cellulose synthase (UDP-forming)
LPESSQRRLLIRSVALVALAVSLVYLGWRALFTLNLEGWYLSIPLWVLELHAVLGLGLFTFSLWDIDRRPTRRPISSRTRIAVLIPTYNEDPEILLPTISAALALEPAHETWVLDDGNRPEIARLAAALGARYLARTDRRHAKAGNLNHALGVVEADIVAVLDADHVARPEFLRNTLGYFADPRVALVQTPQDFYNETSFEHAGGIAYGAPMHEQTLFYRLLQPGKNRWNAAFWCGTNALVRVAALREIGGAATETITEDIHTTVRLHRSGWKTVYHNEVLARELAASDADQYQLQRNRWGTGAMQVLRTESPLSVSGLSRPQRLAYAATLLGWFDAWRTLGFLLLPPLVLITGQLPILADGATFLSWFVAAYGLQQAAMWLLGRGAYRPFMSLVFELVRMTPNLVATLTLAFPRTPRFAVTPKGRTADDREQIHAPLPLRLVLGLSVVAATVYVLTQLHVLPFAYRYEWAAHGAFAWLTLNSALVWAAMRRGRALRFAGERRAAVRFQVDLPGWVDGTPCQIQDLSVGGALLATHHALVSRDEHLVTLDVPRQPISLWATIRSSRSAASREVHHALEFLPGQTVAQSALTRAIFNRGYPEAVSRQHGLPEELRRELAGLSARFRRRMAYPHSRPEPLRPIDAPSMRPA